MGMNTSWGPSLPGVTAQISDPTMWNPWLPLLKKVFTESLCVLGCQVTTNFIIGLLIS